MSLITQKKVGEIIKRTRNGGKGIIDLLKSGFAYYCPVPSGIYVLESYLNDKRHILRYSASLNAVSYYSFVIFK